jgi:hypothetical protein
MEAQEVALAHLFMGLRLVMSYRDAAKSTKTQKQLTPELTPKAVL